MSVGARQLPVPATVADLLFAVGARRGDRVRAEPFEAVELQVGVLFGDDEE